MWTAINNLLLMHQSFVSPAPSGPRNSGAFNFSVSKALLKALHCGAAFVVKSLRKAPAPRGWQYSNEEQQMTRIIWINFPPLSHCGSTWDLALVGPVVSEKILNSHTSTYIFILGSIRHWINCTCPCILAHQNQLRAVPDEIYEVMWLDFLHVHFCVY